MFALEREISDWRARLAEGGSLDADSLAELEGHLRDSVDELRAKGLDEAEAFLVAARRIGNLDAVAGEFARSGGEAEWRSIALEPAEGGSRRGWKDLAITAALAFGTGLLAKAPGLFGPGLGSPAGMEALALNAAAICLPGAALLLAWMAKGRKGSVGAALALAASAAAVAAYLNLLPWAAASQTRILSSVHLPFFLWIALLPLYAGPDWRGWGRRMDFVRFTGESFVYGVLLLCGIGVFGAFSAAIFSSAGFDPEVAVSEWLLPVGAFAAPVAAMRLALAKRSVVETIAPALARIFAPLFLAAMLAFAAATLAAGRDPFADRDALVLFDVILAVVVALLLFSIAMRDPRAAPGFGDWIELGLAVAALGIDAALLAAMAGRVGAWGLTPNRIAALGENLLFAADFAGTVLILGRYMVGKGSYEAVVRWQVAFVFVAFAWAGLVALVLPIAFGGA